MRHLNEKPLTILFFYHYQILGLRVHNIIATLLSLGYKVILVYWQRGSHSFSNGLSSNLLADKKNFQAIPVRIPNVRNPILQILIIPLLYLRFSLTALRLKFDIIHFTHLLFLPLGVFIGRIKKAKIIYDSYEFYILELKHKMPFFIRWLVTPIKLIEIIFIHFVDGIFTVDSVNDFYEKFYRKRNKNTFVLYNLPNLEGYREGPVSGFRKRQKWIVYIGGIEEVKGLEPALLSFLKIKKEFPEAKLFFIGVLHPSAQEKFYSFIKDSGLKDSICHIGWSPHEDMLAYLDKAYLGLALYQPFWLYRLTSLGNGRKIFTYMERGLPVIGPAFGETAAVIKEEKCGILVDTADPDRIAEAAIRLFKHPEEAEEMSRRGRVAVEEKYNWRIESRKLVNFYRDLESQIRG